MSRIIYICCINFLFTLNTLSFPNYLRFQDPPFFIKSMILAKKFYALVNITYYYRLSDKYKTINKNKLIDIYFGILSYLNSNILINKTKRYITNAKLKSIINQILNDINYDLLANVNLTFIINSFYNKFNISILYS